MSAVRAFWNEPATWKAFLLPLGYLVFYQAVGLVLLRVFADQVDKGDILGDASSIAFAVMIPTLVAALALILFIRWVGWTAEVFGPQPATSQRWMWLGPALVIAVIVAHLAGTTWSEWSGTQLVMLAGVGIGVGLAEELATRGLLVKALRDADHSERFVAIAASVVFAILHSVNLLAGSKATTVLVTIVYAFGFGMCMYLSMRIVGTIWAAIVLHALTDPTTFLFAGDIDKGQATTSSGWGSVVSLMTIAMFVLAVIASFIIRGRAEDRRRRA